MPEALDLASRPISGGYFLRRRSSTPDPFVASPHDGSDYRHCFTYWRSERTIRSEALQMIAAARRKVFVASYLIGDDELHAALVAAAHRLVGGIYVITQLDERRLRQGLAELGHDPSAGLQSQKKRFDEMTTRGIYVRGHPDCHAKFLVVDDEVALVSSANLMTDAFDRTGENGVVVTDHAEVERLGRLFARLWHKRCRREATPGRSYALKKVVQDPVTTGWNEAVPEPVMDGRPEIIWTDGDDGERHILETVRSLLDLAERDLMLATFSLVGMRQHRELILDRAFAAVERGVRVRLLMRPRRNREDHLADAATLTEGGVEVYADTETHMKGVIADTSHGALFSANFDSQHGLTTGVETGTRLDGTTALAEARKLFEHALDQATLHHVMDPTHQVLDRKLDAAWRVPWPLDRHVLVAATSSDRSRFAKEAAQGPVLFTEATDARVTLHAGRTLWELVAAESDEHLRLRSLAGVDGRGGRVNSKRRLADWLQDPNGPPRGVAAAVFEWVDI